ncbi:MAG: thermonuclease family protein [Methylophilaceae bacterium]
MFAAHLSAAIGGELNGKVVAISDGDTITLLDSTNTQWKIRLSGIDAPEKSQGFGTMSKKHLSACAYDKNVRVLWEKRDRYQRVIGKVIAGDVDCNLQQIKNGMAWHYKKYAKDQALADRDVYAAAEAIAKSHREGLWIDSDPMPPWEYRHRKKGG